MYLHTMICSICITRICAGVPYIGQLLISYVYQLLVYAVYVIHMIYHLCAGVPYIQAKTLFKCIMHMYLSGVCLMQLFMYLMYLMYTQGRRMQICPILICRGYSKGSPPNRPIHFYTFLYMLYILTLYYPPILLALYHFTYSYAFNNLYIFIHMYVNVICMFYPSAFHIMTYDICMFMHC